MHGQISVLRKPQTIGNPVKIRNCARSCCFREFLCSMPLSKDEKAQGMEEVRIPADIWVNPGTRGQVLND